MNKSKKVFFGFAFVFACVIGFLCFDISRKTTFPGSKPQLQERLKKQFLKKDSIKKDTVNLK
jgi:hypothetical protein